ncbi:MAG: hypothetical protein ABI180_15480 [Microcoleus sp.]
MQLTVDGDLYLEVGGLEYSPILIFPDQGSGFNQFFRVIFEIDFS